MIDRVNGITGMRTAIRQCQDEYIETSDVWREVYLVAKSGALHNALAAIDDPNVEARLYGLIDGYTSALEYIMGYVMADKTDEYVKLANWIHSKWSDVTKEIYDNIINDKEQQDGC